MSNNILDSYHDIPIEQQNKLIYPAGSMQTPFIKKTKITYADFIASGLPSPYVENYIQSKIYPIYSNTHSNAHNGIFMKNTINKTKQYLRSQLNISDDYQILFTGNGTTGAINHLINCIDYSKYSRVVIYLSMYEHYSNHLVWVELTNSNPNIKVEYIPFVESGSGAGSDTLSNRGIIDIDWLNQSLSDLYRDSKSNPEFKKTLMICSISACSNINGIINPVEKIKQILDLYPNNNKFFKYYFADYACSAPYVNINGSLFDAFFFSPHKFIGGPSTPGLLVGKSCIFSKTKPFCPGGGCVKKASSKVIEYEADIEKRESAGTPNIIGIIRVGKIFQLKSHFSDIISHNEEILSQLIKNKITYFEQTYPTFRSVLYNDETKHLPILSFNISNLHYNLVVVLFNDLFGIQTRGGIGCCGLLAEYIEAKYKYRGWCRISFHWLMTKKTITNIFEALEYIIQNGHKYMSLYEYDSADNLYKYVGKTK
jgi:selenocysteine lyase/cysteine desulfurase